MGGGTGGGKKVDSGPIRGSVRRIARRAQSTCDGRRTRHGASLPKEWPRKIPEIATARRSPAPILLESGETLQPFSKTPARRTHTWTWALQDAQRWFARRARVWGVVVLKRSRPK